MANSDLIEKLRSLLLLSRELEARHPQTEIGRIADELEIMIRRWESSSGLGWEEGSSDRLK